VNTNYAKNKSYRCLSCTSGYYLNFAKHTAPCINRPNKYLGSEIHTTILVWQNIGGLENHCVLYVQKLGKAWTLVPPMATKEAMPPQRFRKYSHFVLWEAFFQTKLFNSPKIKHFAPLNFWDVYATGPTWNSVPILRRTYRHLACEHQKVCGDEEVIIKYIKQEFRIGYQLVQSASRRLPATFQHM